MQIATQENHLNTSILLCIKVHNEQSPLFAYSALDVQLNTLNFIHLQGGNTLV